MTVLLFTKYIVFLLTIYIIQSEVKCLQYRIGSCANISRTGILPVRIMGKIYKVMSFAAPCMA